MTQSKVAFYEQIGKAQDVLKVGLLDIPAPAEHEVQVEVMASGVNPSDVKTRAGLRGDLAYAKIIPHSDGAGIVKNMGVRVKNFKTGDRVWIYNAAWHRAHGTACTVCNLPEDLLLPLPKPSSFEVGACLGIPGLTAASCLLSLNCRKGDIIMITGGAGVVGLFAIQLAKFLGYRVLTTVTSAEKAKLALAAGADYAINCMIENVLDKVKEYTNNNLMAGLIDVDFGGNLSWTVDALKENASIATYASAHHPHPSLPFYALVFKQITVKFVFVYSLQDTIRKSAISLLQDALAADILKPIIHKTYNLDDIILAHHEVEAGNKIGQVIIKMW